MTALPRVRAILKINRNSTASVLARAHAVATGLSADPALFADPAPPLATLNAQILRVDEAEQQVGRVKGAAAARDAERDALSAMLETERAYVQTLVDEIPAIAVAIVFAAGMEVADVPAHDTPLLKVTQGGTPGTVHLDAHAGALVGKSSRRVCFNWAWTPDGGVTFASAPSTPHARTTITGLPRLASVGFQVSITDTRGPAPWSPIVTVLVR